MWRLTVALIALATLSCAGCNTFHRLTGSSHGGSDKELVVVVYGQSNAACGGGTPVWSQTNQVQINHVYTSDDFTPGTPTTVNPVTHGYPYIYMADAYYEQNRRPVTIINVAVGGCSLWNLTDPSFGHIQRFETVVQKYQPDVILWTQGESDQYTTKADYYQQMKSLIALSHSLCDKAQWYVSLDGWYPMGQGDVRGAQQELIADGVAKQGPDVDEMRGHPEWVTPDRLHLNDSGFHEFGRRWFDILQNAI